MGLDWGRSSVLAHTVAGGRRGWRECLRVGIRRGGGPRRLRLTHRRCIGGCLSHRDHGRSRHDNGTLLLGISPGAWDKQAKARNQRDQTRAQAASHHHSQLLYHDVRARQERESRLHRVERDLRRSRAKTLGAGHNAARNDALDKRLYLRNSKRLGKKPFRRRRWCSSKPSGKASREHKMPGQETGSERVGRGSIRLPARRTR